MEWDELVKSNNGHPLQLSGWGASKQATGAWQATHLHSGDDFAQILIRKTPLGQFGYIPRGPNFDPAFLKDLKAFARDHNLFMLRFEPNVAKSNWHHKLKSPKDHILIPNTAQLDLSKSPDELLAAMDKKTRQYIRGGERNSSLKVRQATKDDLPRILEVYHETAKRSNFPLHVDTYYTTIYEKMGSANHIYVAEITDPETGKSQVEAFLWCAKTPAICFELYGGASALGLKHRANYLLKWITIQRARGGCPQPGPEGLSEPTGAYCCSREPQARRPSETASTRNDGLDERRARRTDCGSRLYDLNGLLNDGISDFKRGFTGGTQVELAHTSDLVVNSFRYFLFATFLPLAKRFFSARRTSSNS